MKYQRLILALILLALMGSMAYGANVITGLTLHGVVQKIAPETGDDSLTVRDDSLYLAIDDIIRLSFILGNSGGVRLQGGDAEVIEFVHDSLLIDVDSNSATPIITFGGFGGFGGGIRWDRATDKMQFSNDMSSWLDIGTSAGISESDYNNLIKNGSELKEKLDSTAVHIPVSDSADGGAIRSETSKEADSTDGGSIRSETTKLADVATEADSTDGGAIRSETCKEADSTDGGAIRSETTKLADVATEADSTDGGAIRSETSKEADSTDGGATRAESAQGLVGKSVNSTDPADGEVLTYYTTGDTLGWTGAGAGDVTDVVGGAGLVDDGNTGAITVDLQIGSWPLDLNADSVWLDSTEILTWNLWTEAYDWGDHSGEGYLTSVALDEVGNPSADHTFSMSNKDLKFSWTVGGGYEGGLELEATGAYNDEDLVHIHQHTGNVPHIDLLHIESADVDVTNLRSVVLQAADTNAAFINGEVFISRLDTDTIDISGDVIVDLAGTNLSVASNILNVDDAFLVNDANDETSGTITSTGLIIGSADVNEAELEVIDGATLTTTELNYVDGVTSDIQTQLDSKDNDPRYLFTIYGPNSFWVADSILIGIDPRTPAAITVTRIDVTCDADPTTELDFDLMWADARIGNANRAVIDEMNTTNGTTTITSGFDDPTIAANKCIYIRFNAEPDADILDVGVRVTYTID